jgi:hypothetical protein
MDADVRIERDLEEMKAAILRIEQKLESRGEKVEDRLRVLEQKLAQVWVLGTLGVFVLAPLIGLIIRKLGL